jgi:hypothetical protein
MHNKTFNLMTIVGGARALSLGGRHRSEPMQVMGGVRGAQKCKFNYIDHAITSIMNTYQQHPNTEPSVLETNCLYKRYLSAWFKKSPLDCFNGGINLRNAYQEGAGTSRLDLSTRLQITASSVQPRKFTNLRLPGLMPSQQPRVTLSASMDLRVEKAIWIIEASRTVRLAGETNQATGRRTQEGDISLEAASLVSSHSQAPSRCSCKS